MTEQKVVIFKPFPLKTGDRIRIEGSRRNGDWEVIGTSENKVTLRCPVSHKEFTWDRFCYFAEEKSNETWPMGK